MQVTQKIHDIQSGGKQLAAFIAESVMSCAGQIEFPAGYLSRVFEEVRKAGNKKSCMDSAFLIFCISQAGFASQMKCRWGLEEWALIFGASRRKAWYRILLHWANPLEMASLSQG